MPAPAIDFYKTIDPRNSKPLLNKVTLDQERVAEKYSEPMSVRSN